MRNLRRNLKGIDSWIEVKLPKNFYALIAISISALDFLAGYRLTWDDVNGHQTALRGSEAIWEYVLAIAFYQGRVGHFISAPFSMYSALFADELWFRSINVAFYFGLIYLLFKYLDTLNKSDVLGLSLLLTVALHPLAYFHMPPNSYGLFISFPAVLIIGWRLIRRGERYRHLPLATRCVVALIILLATLSSEYMIIFHFILIVFEAVTSTKLNSVQSFSNFLRSNIDRTSIFILSFAVISNLIFRIANPPKYDGVSINPTLDLLATFRVLVLHPLWGLSPPHVFLEWLTNKSFWPEPSRVILSALLAYCVFLLSYKLILKTQAPQRILTSLSLLLAAVIATAMPLALTMKYQSWCVLSGCAYIDSRIESFFIIFSIALVMSWASAKLTKSKSKARLALALSSLICVSVFATSMSNAAVSLRMENHVQAFEKITLVPCLPKNELNSEQIKGLIDPLGLVTATDIDSYWNLRLKIATEQRAEICSGLDKRQKSLIEDMKSAITFWGSTKLVRFKDQESRIFLGSGWSYTEPWGVWSSSTTPEIYISSKSASFSHALVEVIPFDYPFGQIRVLVGENEIFHETLTRVSGKEVLKIPLHEVFRLNGEHPAVLRFEFTDKQTSLGKEDEIRDARQLGIGILSLELIN